MTSQNREVRTMEIRARNDDAYTVEGYASTFDTYVLYRDGDIDFSERIDPAAFDDADLSDVVFRIDHEGPVYARSSAGTLQLDIDEHGLHNTTDLSRTQRSRDIFAELKAGNYPQMSFAFTVAEEHYERDSHTRVIDRIAKVYDVSPVSFPANPNTYLVARSYIDGEIEKERAERLAAEERERAKAKLRLKLKLMR